MHVRGRFSLAGSNCQSFLIFCRSNYPYTIMCFHSEIPHTNDTFVLNQMDLWWYIALLIENAVGDRLLVWYKEKWTMVWGGNMGMTSISLIWFSVNAALQQPLSLGKCWMYLHTAYFTHSLCLWAAVCLSAVAFTDQGEVMLQPTHTHSGLSLFKHTMSSTLMIISAIQCSECS